MIDQKKDLPDEFPRCSVLHSILWERACSHRGDCGGPLNPELIHQFHLVGGQCIELAADLR